MGLVGNLFLGNWSVIRFNQATRNHEFGKRGSQFLE